MRVFILFCDQQHAEEIVDAWLEEPVHHRIVDPYVRYKIESIHSGEKPSTWLSITCNPKRTARMHAVITMCCCLLLCPLALIPLQPALLRELYNFHNPFLLVLLVLGVSLLLTLGFTSPLYTLGRLDWFCTLEEAYLRVHFVAHGIPTYELIDARYWTWFPRDKFFIAGGALLLSISYLCASYHAWVLLSLFVPYILLALLYFIPLTFLRILAYGRLHDASDLPSYWKLEVAQWTQNVAESAFVLLIIVVSMWISAHIGMYLTFQYSSMSIERAFQLFATFNESTWLYGPNSFMPNTLDGMRNALSAALLTLPESHIWLFHYALILEGVFLALFFFAFFRVRESIFNARLLKLFNLTPALLPEKIAAKGVHPATNAAILLVWLSGWVISLLGLGVALLILLTILHILPTWIPWQWLIAFLWYQTAFQTVLGTVLGTIIADALLIMAALPLLLWTLFWCISLLRDFLQFLRLIFSREKVSDEVEAIMHDLCKTLRISHPLIRPVHGTASWPKTRFLLPAPGLSVISLPDRLAGLRTQDRLRQVLAHELGHVIKHAGKVWSLQLLSRLSLTGPGYLTLLLDHWVMEMEADAFAVQATDDSLELIDLLTHLKEIAKTLAAKQPAEVRKRGAISTLMAKKLNSRLVRRTWIAQVAKTYNIYFSDTLWGAFHPPEEERIENLYNIIFERENLGSPDRFTAQAKVVIERAKEEAKRFQNDGIRTEHLLLALLYEDFVINMLREVSNNPDLIPQDLERFMGRGKNPVTDTIDFVRFTKRVLIRAAQEANAQHQQRINLDHLLLGIIQEPNSLASKILKNLNVDLAMLRIAIF